MDVDPICAMCGIMQEDTLHALVSCGYANSIWALSNIPLPNIVTNVFHEWFSGMLNVLDTNEVIYAAAILYHIWRARNGAVWDACLPLPRKIVANAVANMQAWKAVHHATAADDVTVAASTAGLPPPPLPDETASLPETVHAAAPRKCYMDAGYQHATNASSVGAVLLEPDGRFVAAYNAPLPDYFSPLMGEAFACKEISEFISSYLSFYSFRIVYSFVFGLSLP
ncbi:PREDICTED: uncharacterized protein LOC109166651 [Ipomoea nil]|uniref:uncharacterized protein LOC109166651 n=1 Tax=Ipomoea nil TaxID=35883 RepID=UPI000901892B|nr:PREDICTED: uncharacterized protein LOC109166651 [Ipomoea nil]